MPRDRTDAVVVGSGPNGLAAAVTLARAGLEVTVLEGQETVGGGARTLDLGLAPGVVHDVCSAIHPLALSSPFFAAFDLRARGVGFVVPEVSYAQPLDGGRAGIAYRSLARTAEGLGPDGGAWLDLFGPLLDQVEMLGELALGNRREMPRGLRTPSGAWAALRAGLAVLEQGSGAWNARFSGDEAPALITGVAAHAISVQPALASAGTAVMLGTLAHGVGWPVPVGGSGAIAGALVADLHAHGGRVVTGTPVVSWRDLPRARAYLFDTTPGALVRIWGDRMRPGVRRALAAFRHGDAAAKVDYVLSGPVPWTNPRVGEASTVHVGGTRAEMALAEAEVAAGRHADRPMVLLSEPATHDESRISGGLRPVWSYAHVPAGSTRDVTAAVTAQIERFAPGFRDLVVASRCVPGAEQFRHNANYPGGDIAAGAVTAWQMLARPRLTLDPHTAGIPGGYLCSASTPPGPGVHGMGGWHAARRALAQRFGLEPPSLGPARPAA